MNQQTKILTMDFDNHGIRCASEHTFNLKQRRSSEISKSHDNWSSKCSNRKGNVAFAVNIFIINMEV